VVTLEHTPERILEVLIPVLILEVITVMVTDTKSLNINHKSFWYFNIYILRLMYVSYF
jgi:hypothetical protein